MPLKPNRAVQKFLISSTSHFVGEFEADKLLISHAWPAFRNRNAFARWVEGPAARTALVISFETKLSDKEELVIPSYDHIGDMLCSYLSVLYGKRFDNHGFYEASGFFHLPDLTSFNVLCNHTLPQNTRIPRPDFEIELKLEEVRRLTPVLFGRELDERALNAFRGAAKFYWQALRAAEHDIEISYLHLITAGEILCSAIDISEDQLVDAQTRALLNRILESMPDGEKTVRIIRSKLRSIKRRFVAGFQDLTDEAFFQKSEASHPYARLSAACFSRVLASAYDLRSHYVHTGRSFGGWIEPRGNSENGEIQVGRPVVKDTKFGHTLYAAPTYIGLERIVRYGLLRFAQRLGVDLGPSLSPSGEPR